VRQITAQVTILGRGKKLAADSLIQSRNRSAQIEHAGIIAAAREFFKFPRVNIILARHAVGQFQFTGEMIRTFTSKGIDNPRKGLPILGQITAADNWKFLQRIGRDSGTGGSGKGILDRNLIEIIGDRAVTAAAKMQIAVPIDNRSGHIGDQIIDIGGVRHSDNLITGQPILGIADIMLDKLPFGYDHNRAVGWQLYGNQIEIHRCGQVDQNLDLGFADHLVTDQTGFQSITTYRNIDEIEFTISITGHGIIQFHYSNGSAGEKFSGFRVIHRSCDFPWCPGVEFWSRINDYQQNHTA